MDPKDYRKIKQEIEAARQKPAQPGSERPKRRFEANINVHDGLGNKYIPGTIITETDELQEAIAVWLERGQVRELK